MNFRLYSDLGLAYPPRQDFGLASANGTSRNLQNLCQHLLYSLYSWLCEFWNEVFYDYIVIFRDVAFIWSSQAVLMFGRRNTTLDSTSADVAALEVEMREAVLTYFCARRLIAIRIAWTFVASTPRIYSGSGWKSSAAAIRADREGFEAS